MHAWHNVDLGEHPGELFNAVIEIPRGSKSKYELDKETGLLRLDRILYSAVHYPANYGFLPRTYCDDGDPLDALVLCQEDLVPLCIVAARPIGVITMTDDKGRDDKIIAVCAEDPEYAEIKEISDLAPHRVRELKQFLLDYKRLENKEVNVDDLRPREDAVQVILDAIELYKTAVIRR
jgi:inorganic pyrophosphatase